MDIYYSEGCNIYWERIAVYLSAQRMRVSNACNTEFPLFVILGDESIRLVRLCLQVKPFCFNKRLCFVTICLNRQALMPIFESAVLCAFITVRIPMKWFHTIEINSLIRLKHTSIHSVKQGESFKPHSKAIGHTSALQRVFFLVFVNNLSRTRKPFH